MSKSEVSAGWCHECCRFGQWGTGVCPIRQVQDVLWCYAIQLQTGRVWYTAQSELFCVKYFVVTVIFMAWHSFDICWQAALTCVIRDWYLSVLVQPHALPTSGTGCFSGRLFNRKLCLCLIMPLTLGASVTFYFFIYGPGAILPIPFTSPPFTLSISIFYFYLFLLASSIFLLFHSYPFYQNSPTPFPGRMS